MTEARFLRTPSTEPSGRIAGSRHIAYSEALKATASTVYAA